MRRELREWLQGRPILVGYVVAIVTASFALQIYEVIR